MASGKQHFIANCAIACVTMPIAIVRPDLLSDLTYGNLFGILITPDTDNPGTTYPEQLIASLVQQVLILFGRRKSKAKKDVKILVRLNAAITAPYGVFILHRSFISHFPGISTLSLSFYCYCFLFIYWKINNQQTVGYIPLVLQYQTSFLLWTVHNTVHYLMDGGLILFFGERYTLGKPFYDLTRKLFPQ